MRTSARVSAVVSTVTGTRVSTRVSVTYTFQLLSGSHPSVLDPYVKMSLPVTRTWHRRGVQGTYGVW